jgi:hypothetical protein
MRSVLRRAFVVAALVGASSAAVQAQTGGLKIEEIRFDLASVTITNGTFLRAEFPGALALGIYLNDKVALEPSLGLLYLKGDGAPDATTVVTLGLMAPYYFSGDRGHSGVFVSPGVFVRKQSNFDSTIDFGADVGYKGKMSDKVSWRAAATLRDGDSYGDTDLGGVFGFSIFWR